MATKKSNNQSILDVITGISQALSKKYDGSLDDDGKYIEIIKGILLKGITFPF